MERARVYVFKNEIQTPLIFRIDWARSPELTSTFYLSISFKALFAFTDILGRKIAAFGILHTFSCQFRYGTLINI